MLNRPHKFSEKAVMAKAAKVPLIFAYYGEVKQSNGNQEKDNVVSLTKYDRNHARQKAITEGIVNMVVKDLQPAAIVESKSINP